METLAAAFQQELRLALLPRLERIRVVGGARLAIAAHAANGKDENSTARLRLRNDEWIVRRLRNLVVSEGKLDARFEVSNGETRARGRPIRHEKQRAEELIQEADITWNDDEPRNLNIREPRKNLLVAATRRQRGGQHHGHETYIAKSAADDTDAGARFDGHRNLVRVENDGKVDRDRAAVELQSQGEVESREAVVAKQNPLLADLLDRQRTGRDLGDENPLNYFDRGRVRRRSQKKLAVPLESDIADEIETARHERRHGQDTAGRTA